MRRIIIVNNNLCVGGVQKSLINLLKELDGRYEITLFLFVAIGEYVQEIPSNIKLVEGSGFIKMLGVWQQESKKMGLFYYYLRGFLVLYTRFFGNARPIKMLTKFQEKLKGYDCAISFLHSSPEKSFYGGCNEFVLNCIEAKQKIAFIHCDFSNYGGNTEKNKEVYLQFDKIAACSEGCLSRFTEAFPEVSWKSFSVRNCHDYHKIFTDSLVEPILYNQDYFNIITVSRISREKGIKRAIDAMRCLITKGINVKYHIVGSGDSLKDLVDYVRSFNLEESILFYGNQENPYRYMKNADLFLPPSFHEAAPLVVEEAKFLGVPILATKTSSTKEMVEDCNAGWVCQNSSEGILNALEDILVNTNEVYKVRRKLLAQSYDNTIAVKQFENIMNS